MSPNPSLQFKEEERASFRAARPLDLRSDYAAR